MHPDDLYAALRARPFVPFRLHVADGAAYDIRHQEMIAMTRRAVHVPIYGEGPIPERIVVIALVHISRLEELPVGVPPGPNGNGQGGA